MSGGAAADDDEIGTVEREQRRETVSQGPAVVGEAGTGRPDSTSCEVGEVGKHALVVEWAVEDACRSTLQGPAGGGLLPAGPAAAVTLSRRAGDGDVPAFGVGAVAESERGGAVEQADADPGAESDVQRPA